MYHLGRCVNMHTYTPECYCVIEILAEKADRDLLQGPEVPASYKVFIDYNITVVKWLLQQFTFVVQQFCLKTPHFCS